LLLCSLIRTFPREKWQSYKARKSGYRNIDGGSDDGKGTAGWAVVINENEEENGHFDKQFKKTEEGISSDSREASVTEEMDQDDAPPSSVAKTSAPFSNVSLCNL